MRASERRGGAGAGSGPRATRAVRLAALAAAAALLGGCTREGRFQAISMWNDARVKPFEESPMPGRQTSARLPPAGTAARGERPPGDPARSGRSGGKLVDRFPITVTAAVVERGRERYDVFCSPCHGRLGDGEGMVVKRGFPHPPDYAIPRLRNAPVGHLFDVITHGYGVMYSYADRVPVEDRWAVAAYIRLLQEVRPVVAEDRWESERERARRRGIPEPGRPAAPPPPGGGDPGR